MSDQNTIVQKFAQLPHWRKTRFGDGISPSQLQGAIESYAQAAQSEKALLLRDDSWRGNGQSGFLITNRMVYSKGQMQQPRSCSFGEIFSVGLKAQSGRSSVLAINAREFYWSTDEEAELPDIVRLLRELTGIPAGSVVRLNGSDNPTTEPLLKNDTSGFTIIAYESGRPVTENSTSAYKFPSHRIPRIVLARLVNFVAAIGWSFSQLLAAFDSAVGNVVEVTVRGGVVGGLIYSPPSSLGVLRIFSRLAMSIWRLFIPPMNRSPSEVAATLSSELLPRSLVWQPDPWLSKTSGYLLAAFPDASRVYQALSAEVCGSVGVTPSAISKAWKKAIKSTEILVEKSCVPGGKLGGDDTLVLIPGIPSIDDPDGQNCAANLFLIPLVVRRSEQGLQVLAVQAAVHFKQALIKQDGRWWVASNCAAFQLPSRSNT